MISPVKNLMNALKRAVESIRRGGGRQPRINGLPVESTLCHHGCLLVLYKEHAGNIDPRRNLICLGSDGHLLWTIGAAPSDEPFARGWKTVSIDGDSIQVRNSVNKMFIVNFNNGHIRPA